MQTAFFMLAWKGRLPYFMLVCQPYPAKTLMYKKTLLTDLSPSVLPFYFAYTSHNSPKGHLTILWRACLLILPFVKSLSCLFHLVPLCTTVTTLSFISPDRWGFLKFQGLLEDLKNDLGEGNHERTEDILLSKEVTAEKNQSCELRAFDK